MPSFADARWKLVGLALGLSAASLVAWKVTSSSSSSPARGGREGGERFRRAAKFVKDAGESLDLIPEIQLKLYALYKQATLGPFQKSEWESLSSLLDLRRLSMNEAWEGMGDMPEEEAEIKYVRLVGEIYPDWEIKTDFRVSEKAQSQRRSRGSSGGFGMSVSIPQGAEKWTPENEFDALCQAAFNNNIQTIREKGEKLRKKFDIYLLNETKKSESEKGGEDLVVRKTNPKDFVLCTTPLHFAADRGNLDILKLLLSQGWPVDQRDEEGMTPLMSAVFSEQEEAVEALLGSGANPFAEDKEGGTPYNLARELNIEKILKIFEEFEKGKKSISL